MAYRDSKEQGAKTLITGSTGSTRRTRLFGSRSQVLSLVYHSIKVWTMFQQRLVNLNCLKYWGLLVSRLETVVGNWLCPATQELQQCNVKSGNPPESPHIPLLNLISNLAQSYSVLFLTQRNSKTPRCVPEIINLKFTNMLVEPWEALNSQYDKLIVDCTKQQLLGL